jgi:hypothetical protein
MRMKIFSATKPVKRSAALNCLLVNQFATPGLGSLMGGRIIAGLVQLALSLVGFAFVVGWFIQLFMDLYRQITNLPLRPKPFPWLGGVGLVIFAAGWLLAWVTSISLLREARQNAPEKPSIPPKI